MGGFLAGAEQQDIGGTGVLRRDFLAMLLEAEMSARLDAGEMQVSV